MGLTDWLRRRLRGAPRALPSHLRVDEVAPWLFIGPVLPVDEYVTMTRRGVTHAIDLRQEGSDDPEAMAAIGVRWRRFPVADRAAPTLEQLNEVIVWLDHEADPRADQAVYIHCNAGQGRTPTLAIALLMHHGLSLAEAYRHVVTARPEANPTSAQARWLQDLEVLLKASPR